MNHLTSIDASFLHFESPETPMHVGSLMLLDLPAGYAGDYYDDVKAVIAERLPRVQAAGETSLGRERSRSKSWVSTRAAQTGLNVP